MTHLLANGAKKPHMMFTLGSIPETEAVAFKLPPSSQAPRKPLPRIRNINRLQRAGAATD